MQVQIKLVPLVFLCGCVTVPDYQVLTAYEEQQRLCLDMHTDVDEMRECVEKTRLIFTPMLNEIGCDGAMRCD